MGGTGFDVVIVGGGTAGCVLAARLSEDAACSVLLLEAGPDYRADDMPAHLLDGLHGPNLREHDWELTATANGRPVQVPRGRVIGGCSTINATFALRGSPADYDGWRMPGWSWDDVLPSFVRLENDLDFGDASYHGASGPVPVRRYLGEEQSQVAAAAGEALAGTGIAVIADHNQPWAVGVAPLPVNAVDGKRMSTALTHLEAARSRPSLTIRGLAHVDEVIITGGRAAGVRLRGGEMIAAGEVIVSAGTYQSPGLLRASGVDLPALGSNLIDHPAVSVDLPYYGKLRDEAIFQLVATMHSSSANPATDPPDLQIVAGGPWPRDSADEPAEFFIGAALLKPRSRGDVTDRIDLNYYDDADDIPRLMEALDRVEEVVSSSSIGALTKGRRVHPRVTGFAELTEWIKDNTWSYHHPVGTCAMGTVVDEHCRVHDVGGLSVVDASVMPDIPSANTNIPTIMIAEHVVELRRRAASEV